MDEQFQPHPRPISRKRRRRRRRAARVLLLSVLLLALVSIGAAVLKGGDPVSEAAPSSTGSGAGEGIPEGYVRLSMAAEDLSAGPLALVNKNHPLSGAPNIQLTELINDHAVDSLCYPQLQKMMDDCRAAGFSPLICSSFRSQEKQQSLFSKKVSSYLDQGYSQDKAEDLAGREVARPGASEHQLGLAVDICDIDYQTLDSSQEDRAVQKWLMENCQEYGFILRYKTQKSDLTGIIYEPWHYRYVGQPHAKYMAAQDLCMEEYIDLLRDYPYSGPHLAISCNQKDYEVYFCPGPDVFVPEGGDYSVSGNNVDGFIVTVAL